MNLLDDFLKQYDRDWYKRTIKSRITARVMDLNVDRYSCNFILSLHKIITMPYYRITIKLSDKKPVQGIRHYDNPNIDAVTNIARVKAIRYFGERNVIDVEAAMLSNHCKAVKKFLADQQKRKDKKAFNIALDNISAPPGNRKVNYIKSSVTLGEREKK